MFVSLIGCTKFSLTFRRYSSLKSARPWSLAKPKTSAAASGSVITWEEALLSPCGTTSMSIFLPSFLKLSAKAWHCFVRSATESCGPQTFSLTLSSSPMATCASAIISSTVIFLICCCEDVPLASPEPEAGVEELLLSPQPANTDATIRAASTIPTILLDLLNILFPSFLCSKNLTQAPLVLCEDTFQVRLARKTAINAETRPSH